MNLLSLLSCYMSEQRWLSEEEAAAARGATFRRRRQGEARSQLSLALAASGSTDANSSEPAVSSNVSWIVRQLFARNRLANLTFNASTKDFVHTFRGLNKYAQYQYSVCYA